jgi:hypothetical protein
MGNDSDAKVIRRVVTAANPKDVSSVTNIGFVYTDIYSGKYLIWRKIDRSRCKRVTSRTYLAKKSILFRIFYLPCIL